MPNISFLAYSDLDLYPTTCKHTHTHNTHSYTHTHTLACTGPLQGIRANRDIFCYFSITGPGCSYVEAQACTVNKGSVDLYAAMLQAIMTTD